MPDVQRYHSYLLRLWRAGNGHAPEWRLSLEDVLTREHRGFSDLNQLFTFLEEQIEDAASSETSESPSPDADD